MFCKFCNHEVDLAKHIIQCPHCGGEAHEVVKDGHFECAVCGKKFQQTISQAPLWESKERKGAREIPVSEENQTEEVISIKKGRSGK